MLKDLLIKLKIKSKILIIAGSDSSGGAGIQADIKTVTSLGSYALTAITAVTVQNTKGVKSVVAIPSNEIKNQIIHSAKDIKPDAIKIGMLSNTKVINKVLKSLSKIKVKKIILDPVMVAKGGTKLIDEKAIKLLKNKLVKRATLITPNIPEAEILTNMKITNKEDMIFAAYKLIEIGSKNVLIKGGHFKGDFSIDFLFTRGTELIKFKKNRVNTQNTHGTGCSLSAAITAYISKGESLEFSIRKSKEFLTNALKNSYSVGKGPGPVNHFYNYKNQNEL